MRDIKTKVANLSITTLIKDTLGDTIQHPQKNIACISIRETAAEKLVGLTRRIATIKYRGHYNNPSLVRHIYDLYKINQVCSLEKEFTTLVAKILSIEITKFKAHNTEYTANPYQEIKLALKLLESKVWRNNWEQFISDMVFEPEPPSYDDALKNLNALTKKVNIWG